MKIGTIVKLKVNCLGNYPGTTGVVFEEYDLGEPGGSQVIFKNGDYCGFSPDEQKDFFDDYRGFDYDVATYQFTNVIKLSRDFDNGIFDKVFKNNYEN